MHLTREILLALAEGVIDLREAFLLSHSHLVEHCPTCKEEVEAYAELRREMLGNDSRELERTQAQEALLSRCLPLADDPAMHSDQVNRWLDTLYEQPEESWTTFLRSQEDGFCGAPLARRLLAEARAQTPYSPARIVALSQAAFEVCLRSEEEPNELLAQALANAANGKRLLGETALAESTFSMANLAVLPRVTDPRTLAEVSLLQASLELQLGRYSRCRTLLLRARVLYQLLGDPVGEAKVRLKLGSWCFFREQPQKAIEQLRPALDFDLSAAPRIALAVYLNLARFQVFAGRLEEAEVCLDIVEQCGGVLRGTEAVYPGWTRGCLLLEQGNLGEAERFLLRAQGRLLSSEEHFDAAMIAIDLSRVYQQQGRSQQVYQTMRPVEAMLQNEGFAREASILMSRLRQSA